MSAPQVDPEPATQVEPEPVAQAAPKVIPSSAFDEPELKPTRSVRPPTAAALFNNPPDQNVIDDIFGSEPVKVGKSKSVIPGGMFNDEPQNSVEPAFNTGQAHLDAF